MSPPNCKMKTSPSNRLPFDIQLEIIKRLPVKSVIRFRSVCKAWNSSITSSEFIAGYDVQQQHLLVRYEDGDLNTSKVKYVCFTDDDTFHQNKLNFTLPPLVQQLDTRWFPFIIGSSHGLLCLYNATRAVLWNPAIRKSIAVVVPNQIHHPFRYALGFGVCPKNKDPKLVKVTYISECCLKEEVERISFIPNQVMVFTLSSGEWKTLPCNNLLPRKSIAFTYSHIVIDHYIYWVAFDRINVDGEYKYRRHYLIMSFDMDTEEFREIGLPNGLVCEFSISRIKESLVVLVDHTNYHTNKEVCDVWIMEDGDPKRFTKLFTLDAPKELITWIFGFSRSGKPIIMLDHHKNCDELSPLVVYEPYSKNIKELGIWGYPCSCYVDSYTESLLLLDNEDDNSARFSD